MEWVLVNRFDEIVDTCEIASGVELVVQRLISEREKN